MVSRRSLFGVLAASPVIAGSTVKAYANESLGPENTILSLQDQRMKQFTDHTYGNKFVLQGFESYGPQLGISVGKDGNMWVKVDQKWKRVVTE